jgi:hypothetical protein
MGTTDTRVGRCGALYWATAILPPTHALTDPALNGLLMAGINAKKS